MANRDLTTFRQVDNVVADQSGNMALQSAAQFGQDLIKSSQEAKITENFSKAQMDLNATKYAMQNQYADNPFEGVKAFQQAREETLSTYGEDISPFFQGVWKKQTRDFAVHDDAQMQAWAFNQTKQNTTKSIGVAMKNNFQQANNDGQNYGAGKTNDLTAIMNFVPAKQSLQSFGASNLGTDKTEALLQNYDKNYIKSFLSGVAETNPQKAAELLDSEGFKDKFTTEERGSMAELIQTTQKRMDLIDSLKTTQNTADVTGLVNDPQQSYFDKRLKIDQMEMIGGISPKAASNARRVLTSQKNVDSITSTPEMADVVTKMYDLNSQQGIDNAEYLKGVQGLHDLILQKQAQGKINPTDVQKLNNEMKTLTSKRVSDATKAVGNDMYDATQKFNVLPPEYRGEATRQLFYMTNGQQDKLSEDAYKNLTVNAANQVIDKINTQRRQDALKAVQAAGSDEDFLKAKGYTMQDVTDTAKQYGMSEADVIKRLRMKK